MSKEVNYDSSRRMRTARLSEVVRSIANKVVSTLPYRLNSVRIKNELDGEATVVTK